MDLLLWILFTFLLVMVVSIVMDFRDMRKVTLYGGPRLWVNWRAKKYAQDHFRALRKEKEDREFGSGSRSEYNKGLTLTMLFVIWVVAPGMLALILLTIGGIYLLFLLGFIGSIWVALNLLPWYIWAAILLAIPLVTWFTRHITMRVMADIMKGFDSYLPQPMSNICYAHEVPNPDLPMKIQMGPANRQNWSGKETTEA